MLQVLDPSLSEAQRGGLADALMTWKDGASRASKRHRLDMSAGIISLGYSSHAAAPSVCETFDRLTVLSPAALLEIHSRKQARERRAQDPNSRASQECADRKRYALELASFMVEAGLPVVAEVEALSSPEEGWERIFGSRRSKTLRNRVRAWRCFREWLEICKGRPWPAGASDLISYVTEMKELGVGRR